MPQAVLFVNAGASVQEFAQRALGKVDVNADVVDETAAPEAIRSRRYLIVVLDGNDAALPAIREAIETTRPKPLVIVTSRSRMGHPVGDVHVPAPCDPKTLVGVILACLNDIPATPPPNAAETDAAPVC